MTARTIIGALVQNRYRRHFCLPNYTPAKWWECDVFELTKSGYMREYEVKVSRSDFFADKSKTREVFHGWLKPRTEENKHDLIAAGDPRGPSLFWYVTPAGLIQPSELPVWAGLIEIVEGSLAEREIVAAPRIHREKCRDGVRKHALSVCYWRMHFLRSQTKDAA
jgi:hypothetical protein